MGLTSTWSYCFHSVLAARTETVESSQSARHQDVRDAARLVPDDASANRPWGSGHEAPRLAKFPHIDGPDVVSAKPRVADPDVASVTLASPDQRPTEPRRSLVRLGADSETVDPNRLTESARHVRFYDLVNGRHPAWPPLLASPLARVLGLTSGSYPRSPSGPVPRVTGTTAPLDAIRETDPTACRRGSLGSGPGHRADVFYGSRAQAERSLAQEERPMLAGDEALVYPEPRHFSNASGPEVGVASFDRSHTTAPMMVHVTATAYSASANVAEEDVNPPTTTSHRA